MSTIDRGDSHYEDAGGWPEACYHMGVFLHWAARRGLAAPSHAGRVDLLAAAPGAYIVKACDTKLLPDDFSANEALIRTLYAHFLTHYGALVSSALGKQYAMGLDDELLAKIERALDRDLRRLAPDRSVFEPASPLPTAAPIEASAPRRVRHPKFGVGEVTETWTDGGRQKVRVTFESVGPRTLLARFVEPIEP